MASTSTAELVSSNQDDGTVLPINTLLSQATESSVSANSDAPSSSKASLIAERKLGEFFPSPAHLAAPKTKYSDASLLQIANLLRLSHRERWSTVPRIYTVLRNIGQLQLIEEFIDEGFTDIWFPFTTRNLPPRLSPSIKAQFLNTQPVVFTQALDLEKGEGRHDTFAADEPLWFESRGKLGRGAFGLVDKVVSLITLQEYARKRMRRGNNFTKSKREIKEFKAELAILKTVNHQHCVKLVGSYTDPLYLGLIMDPVADCMNLFHFPSPFGTLFDSLGENPVSSSLPSVTNLFIGDLSTFLVEALTNTDKKSLLRGYFGCLASALRYLHERQIRHRDIKPPNILVKGDNVYLADFGIALDWSEMTRATTTADTAKSPIYCAPEVARSEPRGPSADIWSLGCVFAEMVSVLKGFSVEDMRLHFKKASGGYMFHHNVETCGQWLIDLKRASAIDNPPIEWSLKMLVFDRSERYTADQLLQVIQLQSEHDPSKFLNQSFCGECCMDEEHLSSDGNNMGKDPWADSEDEDTLQVHDVLVSEITLEQGEILPGTLKPGGEGHTSSSEAVPRGVPQIDSEIKQPPAKKARGSSIPGLARRPLASITKEQGASITGVKANTHNLNRKSPIIPDQGSKRLESMSPVPPRHWKTETF
jgi:serine/threonine protein kinase